MIDSKPAKSKQCQLESTRHLVASNEDIERGVLIIADLFFTPELAQKSSFLGVTPVRKSLHLGYEAGKLLLPVEKCGCWRDNKERPPDIVPLNQISQDRNRLYSLAAHNVSSSTNGTDI
jgi:hypothetical protein